MAVLCDLLIHILSSHWPLKFETAWFQKVWFRAFNLFSMYNIHPSFELSYNFWGVCFEETVIFLKVRIYSTLEQQQREVTKFWNGVLEVKLTYPFNCYFHLWQGKMFMLSVAEQHFWAWLLLSSSQDIYVTRNNSNYWLGNCFVSSWNSIIHWRSKQDEKQQLWSYS